MHKIYLITEMKMWIVLLLGLSAQALGTQVAYQTNSAQASSSSSSQQQWSTYEGDLSASGNTQSDSFHPLSFNAEDVKQDESSFADSAAQNTQQLSNENVIRIFFKEFYSRHIYK